MSMVTCPECAKDVSSEASSCPSCGYPLKTPPPIPVRPQSSSRTPVQSIPAQKTGIHWGVGCLIATGFIFVLIFVVGMLAAIAIPTFVKARTASQEKACINNLRQIDGAKKEWALRAGVNSGFAVDENEVNKFIPGGTTPVCPVGGSYTYGVIGEAPECSVHGSLGLQIETENQVRGNAQRGEARGRNQ